MSTPAVTPDKLSPEAFASKVKAKHPEYSSVPDATLASRYVLKHPEYAPAVDWSAAAPKQPSNYQPPTPRNPTFDKLATGAVRNAPAELATAGGIVGGMMGGVAAPALAGYGGYVGEKFRQGVQGQPNSEKKALVQGGEQAALELAGMGLAKGAGALASKLAKGADEAVAKVLGLRFAKNPKVLRNTPDAIQNIVKTVAPYVKTASGLESVATKIGTAKEGLNQATEAIVQNTTNARLVPYDHILYNAGIKAQAEASAFNQVGRLKPIDEVVDVLEKKLPSNATTKQVLDVRRSLLKETDPSGQQLWPAGTKQFRRQLYHDLNDGIKAALPKTEAAQFAANNAKVSKLIMAEDAITERLTKQATGQEARHTTGELARAAGKHAILPAIGATAGYERSHSVGGAVAGAAIGAVGSAALGSTFSKVTGATVKRGVARVAGSEYAQSVLRTVPEASRVASVIKDIKSNPQN